MIQVSLANIERFIALITDEVKRSGPVNWRSPADILADALVRFQFDRICCHRIKCGTYLLRRSELIKRKMKHIYGESKLRALVCWCVDPDFLSSMECENNYVGMIKELLALQFHKASVSEILARNAMRKQKTDESDLLVLENPKQETEGYHE